MSRTVMNCPLCGSEDTVQCIDCGAFWCFTCGHVWGVGKVTEIITSDSSEDSVKE